MQIEDRADTWQKLADPFTHEAVRLRAIAKTKDKTRGMVAPYVSARTIMKRLDDVVGVDGWHDRYDAIGSTSEDVFVKCNLTVRSISKEDIGSGNAYKSACSDSLKRAAVKFGIARYLHDLKKPWVRLDERGAIVNEEEVKARILRTTVPEIADRNGTPVDGLSLRR